MGLGIINSPFITTKQRSLARDGLAFVFFDSYGDIPDTPFKHVQKSSSQFPGTRAGQKVPKMMFGTGHSTS